MSSRVKAYLASVALALVAAVSCNDSQEGEIYHGDGGFAFNSGVLNVEVGADDGGKILVPVARMSLASPSVRISFEYDVAGEGEADPQWSDSDPDGLFSLLTTNLMFPDNAYSTNAQIRFANLERLEIDRRYRMRLTIEGEASPSNRVQTVVSVKRKLTFEYLGKGTFFDNCIFEKPYEADVYRAQEAEIYRVMDPYTPGLIAEEYAANGWMSQPPAYIQFSCDAQGRISYESFRTGMLVNGLYEAYAYYPSTYVWGRDFSSFDAENRKLSGKVLQLYPVYCLPSLQYGYLNEGAYPLTITLP